MKVTGRFLLTVFVTLALTRSIEGVLTVHRETTRLNADMRRDSELLGRIVKTSLSRAWLHSGKAEAMSLIDAFNMEGHPVKISWEPYRSTSELQDRAGVDLLRELHRGDMVSLRESAGGRGQVRHSYVPLDVASAQGFVRLTERLEGRSRYIRHAALREFVAATAVILLLGGVVLLLGLAKLGRPLRILQDRVVSIGKGDLDSRVAVPGHDEMSALADGLNTMCAQLAAARERERVETERRLETLEQMRHMDRLTTIGRFSSGVAHELGTPLNVIMGRASMLAEGRFPPGAGTSSEVGQTIKAQAQRMTYIIQKLLDFSRQRPPKRTRVNSVDVARQAADLVTCLGYEGRIILDIPDDAPELIALMDPMQMQQVLINLLENALQAMPDGGAATVRISTIAVAAPPRTGAARGPYLAIAVRDSGAGIPPGDIESVFDPFFTTKEVGEGTGLGLSIAYGIVYEHGGWIEVDSEVGRGSCFSVYIPQEVG